ncbi:MAG TPA: TIGR02266 family protein [Myxococcales bacterium]|nr:TIGR02266 family protein [Myxococcales bacterium]
MAGEERRIDPRFPMVLQVAWPQDPGQIADCTENLSRGGLFVQTEVTAEIGEPVRLRLSFPELLAPMEMEAVVAWIRPASPHAPAGLGVRVADKNPGYRAYLERLAQAAAGTLRQRPKRDTPYRMLIVDDNRLCLEIYQDAVRAAEDLAPGEGRLIEVRVAVRGQQALEMLHERPAELVMTDLNMPGMGGLELIRRVRKLALQPRPAILVVSSFAAPDDRQEAVQAGADACLSKPAKLVDIASTVRALLSL